MKSLIFAATFIALTVGSTRADDRYALIERGDTIIRVDTETGRVSFCKDEGGKPACKIAADEREAWMAEVESLETRIDALRAQVGDLDGKSPRPSGKLSKKEEQDLERAMDVAETMMRRFFGIVKTLKRDLESN